MAEKKGKAPTTTYKAVPGGRLSDKDAVVVGVALDKLNSRDGEVTAATVVGEAAKSSSPLHKFFEWDDTAAAKAHRLEQARGLIRSIQVVIERDDRPRVTGRAYVIVEREERKSYMPTPTVMADVDMRAQLLARALAEMETWTARYRQFEELADVIKVVEKVKGKLNKKAA